MGGWVGVLAEQVGGCRGIPVPGLQDGTDRRAFFAAPLAGDASLQFQFVQLVNQVVPFIRGRWAAVLLDRCQADVAAHDIAAGQ